MGSVKDLTILESPADNKLGLGRFTFSDRYSVFDWGQMPDDIEGKGAALCITSAYFFEKLEEMGVRSHYLGVVEDGIPRRLKDLKNPQNAMQIRLVRIVRPNVCPGKPRACHSRGNDMYSYSPIKTERTNLLIPLEVIYRNSLPEGSSVFKRLANGTLKLEDIGLKETPRPRMRLRAPIFDLSTKLESTDRYLSPDEAKEIAGLSQDEFDVLKNAVFSINSLVTREVAKAGLVNEDGKVEFGFDEKRNLLLLDTVGTLDECRFTHSGTPVSKEILRKHYRGGVWHNEVEEAKKKGGIEWKKLVKTRPEPLSKELKLLVSDMCKSACNEITGREWFKGVASLKEILRKL